MNELDSLRSQMFANMGGDSTPQGTPPPPPSSKAFSDPFQNLTTHSLDDISGLGEKPPNPQTQQYGAPMSGVQQYTPPTPSQPVAGAPPKSATQQMRERMNAQSGTSAPVTKTQGAEYKPTVAVNTESSANPNGSTDTVINTTRQKPVNKPKEKKEKGSSGKFNLNSPKVKFGLIGILVAVGLFGLVTLTGGDSEGTGDEVIEPTSTPTQTEYIPVPTSIPWMYTSAEIEKLREVGYTGTEIEQFNNNKVSFQMLYDTAVQKRDAWVQEAVAPLYDETSDEFKQKLNNTWLGLPENNVMDDWGITYGNYTVRKNLDYEKVKPHGGQLYIKVYFADKMDIGDYFFVNVTPDEWSKLRDKGNVIVSYRYVTQYKNDGTTSYEDKENIIIVGATLEIIE